MRSSYWVSALDGSRFVETAWSDILTRRMSLYFSRANSEKNTIGTAEAPTPLYALPSRQSLVVEELRGGSILSVLRSLKNFYFVENEDGTKGWTPISSVTFASTEFTFLAKKTLPVLISLPARSLSSH